MPIICACRPTNRASSGHAREVACGTRNNAGGMLLSAGCLVYIARGRGDLFRFADVKETDRLILDDATLLALALVGDLHLSDDAVTVDPDIEGCQRLRPHAGDEG